MSQCLPHLHLGQLGVAHVIVVTMSVNHDCLTHLRILMFSTRNNKTRPLR